MGKVGPGQSWCRFWVILVRCFFERTDLMRDDLLGARTCSTGLFSAAEPLPVFQANKDEPQLLGNLGLRGQVCRQRL